MLVERFVRDCQLATKATARVVIFFDDVMLENSRIVEGDGIVPLLRTYDRDAASYDGLKPF